MTLLSVADVQGPWVDPGFESSLIARCCAHWSVPVSEVSNYMLATFIRQRIALGLVVPKGRSQTQVQHCDSLLDGIWRAFKLCKPLSVDLQWSLPTQGLSGPPIHQIGDLVQLFLAVDR